MDVVGTADGTARGNAFRWQYTASAAGGRQNVEVSVR